MAWIVLDLNQPSKTYQPGRNIMRKMWRNVFGTAALAFMLCLAGLVMSGTAFADWCVDNGDGTITDKATGLMWQKATAGPMNWAAAMSYPSSLSLGGNFDWGLPSIDLLYVLYNSPCKSIMEVKPSYYWSFNTNAYYTYVAYHLYFYDGDVDYSSKSNSYYVRAVRDCCTAQSWGP
jgi:hypothetical protein